MPLHKAPPKGPPRLDQQGSQRPQLQERRRTLQTISELSATDVSPLKLKAMVGTGQSTMASRLGMSHGGKKASEPGKRQSLPQYCTSPERTNTRSATPLPSLPPTIAHRSRARPGTKTTNSGKPETGWNARRERARLQAEQDLVGAHLRQERSGYKLQVGSPAQIATASQSSPSSPPLASPTHSSSQQQLLRNSRSMSGMSSSSERLSSFGSTSRYTSRSDLDPDSSNPTSDSSSYNRSPGHVQRNHPGLSAGTIPHHTLPMPASTNTPVQGFYENPHNGSSTAMHRPHYHSGQLMPNDRAWSFPAMSMNHNTPYYVNNKSHGNPHHTNQETPARNQPSSRNPRHEPLSKATSPAASVSSRHKSPVAPQAAYTSLEQRRSLPPPIRSPPPAYTASAAAPHEHHHMHMHTHTHTHPDKPTLHPSPNIKHEQRAVPKRERLTQWKTEREEAKAEFDGMQRAKMRERVRRANELEQQKERELRLLGKGMANEKACRVLGRDVDGEMMERAGERGERKVKGKAGQKVKEKGQMRSGGGSGSGEKVKKGEEEGCFGGMFEGMFGKKM